MENTAVASKKAPSKAEIIIAQLTAERDAALAKLNEKRNRPLSMKVGLKKGISVYGTQAQYPLTQYATQWQKVGEQVFGLSPEQFAASPIGKFIEEHRSELSFGKEEAAA